MRNPKVKIPKVDMIMFSAESMQIDTFWDDLIAYGDISYKRVRAEIKHYA